MTTFVLIPGAGGAAWAWHLVEPRLRAAGHQAVAVELPSDDASAGLAEYADAVVQAAGDAPSVVLVALSFGGFTAPVVAPRLPVERIVLVNAMIPLPGERGSDWWADSGATVARKENGHEDDFFFHDIPPDLAARMQQYDKDESSLAMGQPCPFERWPQVPVHVLTGADERLFPASFQTRLARERLGVANEVVPGGHLLPLANPAGTADRLLAWAGGAR